jgi:hypothetical protein
MKQGNTSTTMVYLPTVFVIAVFLLFFSITLILGEANAQQNSTTTNMTAVTGTNFTKLFSENKDFQSCFGGTCVPAVDVAYQGPIMLVLKSGYLDIVWKAVELAKKEGYKIDGISTFNTTSERIGGGTSGAINVLVVMSKS